MYPNTIFIIVSIIVFLYFIKMLPKAENFDTYYNHSFGAQDIYGGTLKAAEMEAKYRWHEKDSDGLNVYDKFYEKNVPYGEFDVNVLSKKQYPEWGSDSNSIYTTFNGQTIHLNQKNY